MISHIKASELDEYIDLSTKSGIIFNQWYFIDHSLFNSSMKFNGSIIENNKVSKVINLSLKGALQL